MSEQYTDEQVKKYMECEGNRCPECDSPNIESGTIQADGDTAWSSVICGACGAEFQEQYKLCHVEPE